ncbi:MAG: class I SAM-dependent methyltransferase [archaeon]
MVSKMWTSGPRYLCRKTLALEILRDYSGEGKKIVEIGFGSGDMLLTLDSMGFQGVGIDFSRKAVQNLEKKTAGKKFNFEIKESFEEIKGQKFSMLLAFEVLEHIEDDANALKEWSSLLSKNGCILFSVPAHMKEWGANDEYGGHFRRYEKKELNELLEKNGFEVKKFWCYGYPIAGIAKIFKDLLIKKKIDKSKGKIERTKNTGLESIDFPLGWLFFNNITMAPFFFIQKFFLEKDIGDGYLVLCQKKN